MVATAVAMVMAAMVAMVAVAVAMESLGGRYMILMRSPTSWWTQQEGGLEEDLTDTCKAYRRILVPRYPAAEATTHLLRSSSYLVLK